MHDGTLAGTHHGWHCVRVREGWDSICPKQPYRAHHAQTSQCVQVRPWVRGYSAQLFVGGGDATNAATTNPVIVLNDNNTNTSAQLIGGPNVTIKSTSAGVITISADNTNDTYPEAISALSVNGKTITYKKYNGTSGAIITQDTHLSSNLRVNKGSITTNNGEATDNSNTYIRLW